MVKSKETPSLKTNRGSKKEVTVVRKVSRVVNERPWSSSFVAEPLYRREVKERVSGVRKLKVAL